MGPEENQSPTGLIQDYEEGVFLLRLRLRVRGMVIQRHMWQCSICLMSYIIRTCSLWRELLNTHSCHGCPAFAPSDLLNCKHCTMLIVRSAGCK